MHVTHIECLPYGGNQGGTTEQMLRPFADGAFFRDIPGKESFPIRLPWKTAKQNFLLLRKGEKHEGEITVNQRGCACADRAGG